MLSYINIDSDKIQIITGCCITLLMIRLFNIHCNNFLTNTTLDSVTIFITNILILITFLQCLCGVLHHPGDRLLQGGGYQGEVGEGCLCQGEKELQNLLFRGN